MIADLAALGLLAASAVATVAAASEFGPSVETALGRAKEIHVATRRRDGTRSASAPVWFMYDGTALYFSTSAGSHKAKRLRNGGPVYISVGAKDGPSFEGYGTPVSDPQLIDKMAAHYRKKYWIAWVGLFVPDKNRVAAGKTLIVKVTPVPGG
jgi:PPOX class probable F420-dependent enzyme